MRVRNISHTPLLDKTEGYFWTPIPQPPVSPEPGQLWYCGLKPHDRLFYHQTLSILRKSKRFCANPNIPKDTLDFALQSRYDQTLELFPDRVDTIMQAETVGKETFRLLRNTKKIKKKSEFYLGHPLQIGGLTEKISPHSVKLINSGHHTQLTNNGYSRQSADGNFFHY